MKKDLLTVKELAAELRMSPKSIKRAYGKGESLGQLSLCFSRCCTWIHLITSGYI